MSLLPPPQSPTKDFFDTTEHWLASPDLAFASWLKRRDGPIGSPTTRKLKPATIVVYLAMWRKFTTWLSDQGVALDQCDKTHVLCFLEDEIRKEKKDTKQKMHRIRYLRLIERTYDHLVAIGLPLAGNPARQAAWTGVRGKDDATKFLSVADRQRLIRYIEEREDEVNKENWILVRDRALLGLLLGAGVKVTEARRVAFNCIGETDWMVSVAGAGGRIHRTRLLPFARGAVGDWLRLRALLEVPGKPLFPAVAIGARRQKLKGPDVPMHAASIYRRAQKVIAAAGIKVAWMDAGDPEGDSSTVPRMCAQTLRNTFAAMLMDDGLPNELITEYLGVALDNTVARLRIAYDVECGRRPGKKPLTAVIPGAMNSG